MIESYEDRLFRLAREDDRILVLTAENRAPIRGLPERLGDRFLDVGIAEQTLVGAAAGLALQGRIPIAHALASFLTMRAFEFIRTDVAIPHLPVKLVGSAAGILSEANGPTHQALEDVALMRSVPGVEVFCPADAEDLVLALPAIVASPAPAYIRLNLRPPALTHDEPFEIGRAEFVERGSDILILCAGALLREALEASRRLASGGLSIGLINVRSVEPLDEGPILDAVRSAAMTVVIEDHFRTGGLATVLADLLLSKGETAAVLPISFPARWFEPALLSRAIEAAGLDGPQLAGRIRTAWRDRRRTT